jgi:hypothetical protein
MEHPSITNSFLQRFDLYDKHGNLTGFITEGGKSYLALEDQPVIISGIKGRKGKIHGRQKYELTATAESVMRDLIKITTPARDYLRSIGDENWKKLFIASSSNANKPRTASIPRWNETSLQYQQSVILEQFHPHTDKREDVLLQFLAQISPSTIRASRCMEEYLDTGSTYLMSECLGHEEEDSVLLECYVPPIFMAFIEEQGVRLVQKALICHSLRDSPFLVEGANFESLEELEQVLENYTLKNIPDFLKNPDYLNDSDITRLENEIIIRIGVGSLTALLSLAQAVEETRDKRHLSKSAQHWAKLTSLIVVEIESGTDAQLKEKLRLARAHADPRRMEKIINERQQ